MAARHHAFILQHRKRLRQNHGDAWFVEAAVKRDALHSRLKLARLPDTAGIPLSVAWRPVILDAFTLPPVLNAHLRTNGRRISLSLKGSWGCMTVMASTNYCSTAAMAKQLGCPVILPVDAFQRRLRLPLWDFSTRPDPQPAAGVIECVN